MRKSRFTEAQIIGMIKEQEAGMPTVEMCRRHGLSPASFYKFRQRRSRIAAQVANVTYPNGTAVSADAAGFAKATEILSGGGTVMYQGATGNVRFDSAGDVSAPPVTWTFTETGTQEASYITLEEVDKFMASVN